MKSLLGCGGIIDSGGGREAAKSGCVAVSKSCGWRWGKVMVTWARAEAEGMEEVEELDQNLGERIQRLGQCHDSAKDPCSRTLPSLEAVTHWHEEVVTLAECVLRQSPLAEVLGERKWARAPVGRCSEELGH